MLEFMLIGFIALTMSLGVSSIFVPARAMRRLS